MIRAVNSLTPVKSLVVSTTPVLLMRVGGYFNTAGATDFYILVLNAIALPANGTVPVKSYQAQANFEFNAHIIEGVVCTTGCVIALSSTKDTLTIATAGGDTMNVMTDIEEYETKGVKPTNTTAGDLTTAVVSRVIWSNATGPKKLVRLQVTETDAVAAFVGLYATDALVIGTSKPIREWPIAASASLDLQFGLNGVPVYTDDADFTLRKGCLIGMSLTTNLYDGASHGTIKGTYTTQ